MISVRRLHKNFFIILAIDLLVLIGSLYAALSIRFEFDVPTDYWILLTRALPFILLIKLTCFYFLDLYRGMWRYTSISDLLNVIKATSVSSLIVITFILFSSRFEGYSRSVFIIDWCFNVFLISGVRLGVRFFFERFPDDKYHLISNHQLLGIFPKKSLEIKNLLIIGAGDCGEKIYREIRNNAILKYKVVGFLDDHSTKLGMKIHGITIRGAINELKDVARKVKADEVLIAIPSANAEQMRRIVNHCRESEIKFKTVPGMGELINGSVSINTIRKVAYRDLLGRDVIQLDEEKIGDYLKDQSVLITGAGGSIGSELCRQICRFKPKKIALFERAESPLYEIELELKQKYKDIEVVPLLGDIQDLHQIDIALESFKPNTIFHAAAYKHVPMLELQPWKAIENNIRGTLNLVDAANKFKIERFVFVSTDKAVRPTNVMGATKRVSEMLVQSQNAKGASNSTRFMIVRFGNVVGSVGSVVPLFKRQIKRGGPVTVTHPDVTRYFMTIPEACQLILQAGALGNGKGVEIFLFDMGTPIRIADMAKDLIRLSGFEPGVNMEIEYVGLRPGEKLYEELITEGEGVVPTSHKKIMVLKGKEHDYKIIKDHIHVLAQLAKQQDAQEIKAKLKEVVPEYHPSDELQR